MDRDAKKGEVIPFSFRNMEFHYGDPQGVHTWRKEEWEERGAPGLAGEREERKFADKQLELEQELKIERERQERELGKECEDKERK